MPLVETESLVLKNYDLAEADKIVVFLTRDHGLVRGVARGVKRLKSKFGSGLEPLSVVKLTYFQKDTNELVSIQQAELIDSNFGVAGDPDFLQKFSYLVELVVTFSPPHDPNEKLFRMMRAAVDAAAADPTTLDAIGLYFEIWLLRLAGFLPDWSKCERCSRDIADTAYLSPTTALQCEECGIARGEKSVSHIELTTFRSSRNLSPSEFASSTKLYPAEIARLSAILRRVIAESAGREIGGEISLAVRR
jgi:DNA repair protein RecO (recombination protein O)